MLKHWDKMLERHELPECRPHDLRHSAAEIALEHGAALIELSRFMGHSDTNTTDRVYAGRLARSSRRVAESIALAFGDESAPGADGALADDSKLPVTLPAYEKGAATR